ncbi:MAG TPA: SUKH-3 domain-containing protein [Candidatus Dormibacteraeota bacterium]|nr:SUKH-3 domain-containing protein [Candidatus Dormibacteraeota bacterium]
MRIEGFEVFDRVIAFLEEFSGLRFGQPVPIEGVSDTYFHFDMNEVCMNLDPDLVTQWKAWAGVRLCPIVESQHGHETLSMSPDGSVLVGTEHSLAKVADSGADAVAKLASSGKIALIH